MISNDDELQQREQLRFAADDPNGVMRSMVPDLTQIEFNIVESRLAKKIARTRECD